MPAALAHMKLPPLGRAVVATRPQVSLGNAESPRKGLLKEAAMLSAALCPTSLLLYREWDRPLPYLSGTDMHQSCCEGSFKVISLVCSYLLTSVETAFRQQFCWQPDSSPESHEEEESESSIGSCLESRLKGNGKV